jgi:hypothetical protein
VSSGTDENGRTTVQYTAPSSPGTQSITVSGDLDGSGTVEADETVTFSVDVVASGSGGGADYDLFWTNPGTTPGAAVEACSGVPCDTLALEVQAEDPSGPTIDGAPVSFGSSNSGVAAFGSSDDIIRGGTATAGLDRGSQGRTTLQAYSGGNRATLGLVVHLSDGFEDGSLGPEWTNIDGGDASVLSSGGSSVNQGSNAAVIADVGSAGQGDPSPGGGFQLNGGIDSSAGELVVVEFWARENGPEPPSGNDNGEDESLYVEYLDSSGNWVTAANLGVDGTPTNYPRRLRISDPAAFHPDFAVRFRQKESTGSDDWYVDDVAISVFGPAGSTESDLGGNTIGSGSVPGGGGGTGDSDPPSVTTITVEDAPIDYADAANQETVIVEFDEPMDTSVEPTVTLLGVTASDASGDSWADDTTFRETVNIAQNSEDVTATVEVSDAQDTSGNTMSPNPETAQFVVDTERPGDVQAIATPIEVSASNADSVQVDVTNPGTVYGDEDIRLTFEGPDGGVVTTTEPLAGGAGETTSFDVDVSSLADGTTGFSVSAVAVDDVGNTGATKTVTSVTKDTVAPSVTTFNVTRTGADELTVTVEATDATTGVKDLELSFNGPGNVTRVNANNNSNADTYTYELSYEVDQPGEYTATLDAIVDGVGNDGAAGKSDSATVSAAAEVTYNDDGSIYDGENSAVQFSISNGNQEAVTIERITVTTTDSGSAALKERIKEKDAQGPGSREIFISASDDDGYYEAGDGGNDRYSLGTEVALTSTASVSGSGEATFTLYRFYDGGSGGSGSYRDQRGETITVLIEFGDGSTKEIDVAVPN